MATAYYCPAACRGHDMGPGHPERPQRLDAIGDQLIASGLDALLDKRQSGMATTAQLERAHDAGYIARLSEFCAKADASGQRRSLDADTIAGPGTWSAALAAAGAAVAATDTVLKGQADNAFCAIRPPGHHATRDRAMGFCFFNNVCVAAYHALEAHGLERVAIVDFDVHHGNGTEAIVAGDERLLMVSFFEHPLYPGSGTLPLGDNMVNVPVPPYTQGKEIRALIDKLWLPRLDAFKPQLLVFSAGFDAHRDDELAELRLVEDDYAWITRRMMDVARRHAGGRIVSCLEGGYALSALGRSVAAHVRALLGA